MYGLHTPQLQDRAESLFERSWRKGQLKRIWAALTGQSRLIPLLSNHHSTDITPLGICEVRIEQIIGTEGKLSFDKDFLPLQRRSKSRWVSVAVAMMSDATLLPPIDTVQVGDDYYVRDGHHRVSVARALGHIYIDSEVTLWGTPPFMEN